MGRRGPKKKHSVDDLHAAAIAIVVRGGIGALNMSALARELGTSVSGLYRYVSGIEDVHVIVQERSIQLYQESLEAKLEDFDARALKGRERPQESALARVLFCFRFYDRFSKNHPAEYQIISTSLSDPRPVLSDEAARKIDLRLHSIFAVCVQTLDDAVACGAVTDGDPLQRTHMLWAALYGLSHFKKRDRIQPDRLKTEVLVRAVLTTMILGFGATDRTVQGAWKFVEQDG